MMQKSSKAFAPATVANVACGFDVFGFAVHNLGDEAEVSLNDSGKVIIQEISGDQGQLPREAEKNTAGVAVIEFLKKIKPNVGVDIRLQKKLPIGSGLGSSASSAVAALVAVNQLFDNPVDRLNLLPFAIEAERIACGSAHADNVAPSLLGGFVLVRSKDPLDVISIPVPEDLYCVLAHPKIQVSTRIARQVLKQSISLGDATAHWGNTAAFTMGMVNSDFDLIARSLEDRVAEPYRALLIPGYYSIKSAALEAGALGCGISGSGPTLFALCKGEENAHQTLQALQHVFEKVKLPGEFNYSTINQEGARFIG